MPDTRRVAAGTVVLGSGAPLALIAGPCVIESPDHAAMIAESLVKITSRCGLPFIFKASYDKANRTSLKSFRGPATARASRPRAPDREKSFPMSGSPCRKTL